MSQKAHPRPGAFSQGHEGRGVVTPPGNDRAGDGKGEGSPRKMVTGSRPRAGYQGVIADWRRHNGMSKEAQERVRVDWEIR